MGIKASHSADNQTTAPRMARRSWRPTFLRAARALWIVIALISLTTFVLGIRQRYQLLAKSPNQAYFVARTTENRFQAVPQWSPDLMASSLATIGLSANRFAAWQVGLQIIPFLVFCGLSLILFLKQPNNLFVLYVSLLLLLAGSFLGLSVLFPNNDVIGRIDLFIQFEVTCGVLTLAYLFPTGQFVPRRTRWLMPLWFLIPVGALAFTLIYFNIMLERSVSNLILLAIPLLVFFLLYFGLTLSLPLAQIYRYRRVSTPTQRQQTKWFAFAVFTYVIVYVAGLLIPAFNPSLYEPTANALAFHLLNNTIERLAWTFLALGITIPILRYRLWDIDLIINRTLIYAPLTALLAVLFALTNSLLNFLLSGIAGGNSQISLVVNTAVIVLAFNPLKDKLQEIVDKRFKAKPNPAKQLEEFSAQLRAQLTPLDVPRVTRAFLRTIVQGYDADGAQLDLNYQDIHLTNSFGKNGATPNQQIPLLIQKNQVGQLNLGARRKEREWQVQDLKVISDAANVLAEEILVSTTTLK